MHPKLWWILTLGTVIAILPLAVQANVCLMVYQLADNNLEEATMRQDFYELTQSNALFDSTLTTWVYFDGRNYNHPTLPDITEPLQGAYYSNGNPLTVKSEGSQYFTWDHALQKMIFVGYYEQELNGDDPQMIYDFLTTALADCVLQPGIR